MRNGYLQLCIIGILLKGDTKVGRNIRNVDMYRSGATLGHGYKCCAITLVTPE